MTHRVIQYAYYGIPKKNVLSQIIARPTDGIMMLSVY